MHVLQKARIGYWVAPMAKQLVNLDALIIREDLHKRADDVVSPANKTKDIKINELTPESFFLQSLRKPDFQRETASWSPESVVDLVESFLKGDFVPSIILWFSADGKSFVIDGAHRLSALIAWVHDDYGDKKTSLEFFSNFVPTDQARIADKTRSLMRQKVGSYDQIKQAGKTPKTSEEKHVKYSRNAGTLAFDIQWVEGNDPDTAEASFKKINRKATLIDATEFQLIESRKKPNGIAARALMRAGVGHKFWGSLIHEAEITTIAKDIYDMLFIPEMDEGSIKTLDLPVAGKGYSADTVKLLFDFINLTNNTVISQSKLKELADDTDGSETIKYLRRVKHIIARICSAEFGSLGLHPAVYFYGLSGRYQPTAFLATVKLLMEMEARNELDWFAERRARFEDFLVQHRYFVNQIVNQFGSGLKGFDWVYKLYRSILENVDSLEENEMIRILISSNKWRLKDSPGEGKKFDKETKSAIFLKAALNNPTRCGICNARIHRNSMESGHIQAREDGGINHSSNGQLEHPFCNHDYNERKRKGLLKTRDATPRDDLPKQTKRQVLESL